MTALAAALVLALSTAPSVTTFLDPAGDAGTAPDLTKTTLTSANGTYTFVFVFATPYGENSDLSVYVDLDPGFTQAWHVQGVDVGLDRQHRGHLLEARALLCEAGRFEDRLRCKHLNKGVELLL